MNNEQSSTENVVVEQITEIIVEKQSPSSQWSSKVPSYLRLPVVWTGLLSAALVYLLAYFATYIGQSQAFSGFVSPTLSITLTVTYILGFLLAAGAPAVYAGTKRGTKFALAVLISEFIWFVILFAGYYAYFPTGQAFPGAF